jgi:hypothetical protein
VGEIISEAKFGRIALKGFNKGMGCLCELCGGSRKFSILEQVLGQFHSGGDLDGVS